ncbi:MAG: ArsR/SmtB family transcription factor, partial [Candidatus Aminicenantales bacterium]
GPDAEACASQARMFRALAHPARVRLLHRLLSGDCCVSEAEKCLNISQPNVSQHLKILKTAGLVAGERRGAKICYRLIDARAERILRSLATKENPDEFRR